MKRLLFLMALLSFLFSCSKEEKSVPLPPKNFSVVVGFEDFMTGLPIKGLAVIRDFMDTLRIGEISQYATQIRQSRNYHFEALAPEYMPVEFELYGKPFNTTGNQALVMAQPSNDLDVLQLQVKMLRSANVKILWKQVNDYKPLSSDRPYMSFLMTLRTYRSEDFSEEPLYATALSSEMNENTRLDSQMPLNLTADLATKVEWTVISSDYGWWPLSVDTLAKGELPLQKFLSQQQNEIQIEF